MAPAFDTLVLEHRPFARRLARRYVRGGLQREDLEQVAYLGLVKAARRYEPERGVAFTTYALPTIIGELRRFCRDTRWAAHVPRAMQERVQDLRRFEAAQGSTADAAAALGWSEEDVLEVRAAARCLRAQSLNETVPTPDGTIGEVLDCLGEEDAGFTAAERRVDERLQDEAFVRLADADPDLFAGIPDKARRSRLPRGPWRGSTDALVLSGALLRTSGSRPELFGPGDVLLREDSAGLEVVAPTELAVLDESLRRRPSVVDGLARRAADRAHAHAVLQAITDLSRPEDRLVTLFKTLADRWGRRTPDGVAISVPLTRETLACLAGVHRRAAATALRRLEHQGRVRRTAADRWLLQPASRTSRASGAYSSSTRMSYWRGSTCPVSATPV